MPVAVGTFATPTSTDGIGSYQSISGLSFTPKAVILIGANNQAIDDSGIDNTFWVGMATGSGATEQQVSGGGDVDGYFAQNCGMWCQQETLAIYDIPTGGAPSAVCRATLESFDSDGVTFDYTVLASSAARYVGYIAIGGANVSAKLLQFQAVTGVNTANAITGAGFQPDALIIAAPALNSFGAPEANWYWSLGVASSPSDEHCVSVYGDDGGSSSTAERDMRNSRIVWEGRNAGIQDCSLQSMDADGFTLFHHQAANGTYRWAALCLQGIDAAVTDITEPATATTAAVSGLGFAPELALMLSNASAYGHNLNARMMAGAAASPTARFSLCVDSDDGAGSMITGANLKNNAIINYWDAVADDEYVLADVASFDAGGVTFSWSQVTGSATNKTIGLFIGDTGAEPGGATYTPTMII